MTIITLCKATQGTSILQGQNKNLISQFYLQKGSSILWYGLIVCNCAPIVNERQQNIASKQY